MKDISQTITKAGQRATLVEVLRLSAKIVVRIDIESDSYLEQCSAQIRLWTPKGWMMVHTIAAHSMKTGSGVAYKPNGPELASFAEDREELLSVARAVLGVK